MTYERALDGTEDKSYDFFLITAVRRTVKGSERTEPSTQTQPQVRLKIGELRVRQVPRKPKVAAAKCGIQLWPMQVWEQMHSSKDARGRSSSKARVRRVKSRSHSSRSSSTTSHRSRSGSGSGSGSRKSSRAGSRGSGKGSGSDKPKSPRKYHMQEGRLLPLFARRQGYACTKEEKSIAISKKIQGQEAEEKNGEGYLEVFGGGEASVTCGFGSVILASPATEALFASVLGFPSGNSGIPLRKLPNCILLGKGVDDRKLCFRPSFIASSN